MRPPFPQKADPPRLHRRGHHHPPSCPRKLVALRGDSPPFFLVGPMRATARHAVERLTESPVTASMYSQRFRRVTKGRSRRSSSSSFLAFSSSLGRDPGLFFGAKGSPRSALLT